MNDREPQAATLAERTVEGLKQRLGLLGGHTDPFVGHRQDADGKSVDYFVGSTEPKPAALGHRTQAVGSEIPDDLADVVLVRLDNDFISRRLDVDGVPLTSVGAVAQQRRCVLNDGSQVQSLDFESLRSSICEK